MAVSDYSTTANDNTSISGIAVTDSTAVDSVDNIIRQLMADVRAFYDQVQDDNALNIVTTGGSGGAYTITATQSITAYAAGQTFLAILNHTGDATTNTLNVDSLGAKTIRRYELGTGARNATNADLATNDIVRLTYDGTYFVVTSHDTGGVATETRRGPVEAASAAELEAGTQYKWPDASVLQSYIGWNHVETVYSTGTEANVTTSDFEDGYEYAILIDNLKFSATARPELNFSRESDSGYLGYANIYSSGALASSYRWHADIYLKMPRVAKRTHVAQYLTYAEDGGASAGTATNQPVVYYAVTHASADKIKTVRIRGSAGDITNGTIDVYRRPCIEG